VALHNNQLQGQKLLAKTGTGLGFMPAGRVNQYGGNGAQ
jgi:hypothetical protein